MVFGIYMGYNTLISDCNMKCQMCSVKKKVYSLTQLQLNDDFNLWNLKL